MILDGNFVAQKVKTHCAARIKSCTDRGIRPPSLAIIQVGSEGGSDIYVKWKKRDCEEIGAAATHYHFQREPDDYIVDRIRKLIDELNADAGVDGIILQLPLMGIDDQSPHGKGYYTSQLCQRLAPSKDVDGLRPDVYGKLADPFYLPEGHLPCTPTGILMLLDWYGYELEGCPVTIVGRSRLVGWPLYQMLINRNAEGTLVHSKCHEDQIWQEMRAAKIIVSAVGQPGKWTDDDMDINEHPVLIDVGTTVVDGKLKGDFCLDYLDHFNLLDRVDYTPVPGGVGPMTRAALMYNLTQAWERHLREKGELLCPTKTLLAKPLLQEYERWSHSGAI